LGGVKYHLVVKKFHFFRWIIFIGAMRPVILGSLYRLNTSLTSSQHPCCTHFSCRRTQGVAVYRP